MTKQQQTFKLIKKRLLSGCTKKLLLVYNTVEVEIEATIDGGYRVTEKHDEIVFFDGIKQATNQIIFSDCNQFIRYVKEILFGY